MDRQTFEVTVEEKDRPGSVPEDVTLLERERNGGSITMGDMPQAGSSGTKANTEGTPGQGTPARAPMPGNIVSILVQEGDVVERGQPLLVLEAMKMENDIVAPQSGRIERVLVNVDQSVETGQELIRIA